MGGTINSHIKNIRHALKIVDARGTQELRERLITIKRPRTKKEIYIPTDEELARFPKMLKNLGRAITQRTDTSPSSPPPSYNYAEDPMPYRN